MRRAAKTKKFSTVHGRAFVKQLRAKGYTHREREAFGPGDVEHYYSNPRSGKQISVAAGDSVRLQTPIGKGKMMGMMAHNTFVRSRSKSLGNFREAAKYLSGQDNSITGLTSGRHGGHAGIGKTH